MVDYTVYFKLFTNISTSNPSPNIVVPFIFVDVYLPAFFQAKGGGGVTTTEKLQAQKKE